MVDPPLERVYATKSECDVSGCHEPTEWVHVLPTGTINLCRTHHAEGVSDRDRSHPW
jgi:hypothetical protein